MTEERTESTQLDDVKEVDIASDVISEIETESKEVQTESTEEAKEESPQEQEVKVEVKPLEEPENVKVLRTEMETLRKQHEELIREARKAIQDPEYYKEQRRLMGLEKAEPKQEQHSSGLDLSGVQTAQDLSRVVESYVNSKIEEAIRTADATVKTRVTEATEPFVREKWDKARSDLKEKYGEHFAKVELNILQHVQGDYSNLLRTAKSEKDLMEKIMRAEYPEEYIAWEEKQRKDKRTRIQNASTEKPSKKTPSSKRLGIGDPIAEEVISEILSELGEA